MPSSSQTCHQNPSSSKGNIAKRSNSSKSSISTPSKSSAHSSPLKSHSSGNSSSKSASKRANVNSSSSRSSTNSSPTKCASESCNYSMQQFSRTSSRTDLSDVYDMMESPQRMKTDDNPLNRTEALYNIPLAKIRTIMKTTQDPLFCSEEGLFAMTKATEEFIKLLTKGTYDMDPETNLLHYSSLANYVHKKESLDHLREIVPQRVKFSKIKESLMAARAEYEKNCD